MFSRPVIESSGWTHTIPNPEVLDAHDYNQDPESFGRRWEQHFSSEVALPSRYGMESGPVVPFFVSEYGGIGWNIDKKGWGYGDTPADIDAFYNRFKGLADAQLDNRNLFGLCYTQLTDIEQEQNGLYTYDRQAKFDTNRLQAILSREAAYEKNPPRHIEAAPAAQWRVLVGAMQDGERAKPWRYTTEEPAEGWESVGFDAEDWAAARAPFGRKGGWGDKIRTGWKTKNLWLRQEFECDDAEIGVGALVAHHDDDIEVYLNGAKIWSRPRWNNRYEGFDVTEALQGALKEGTNVVAVHVHQDHGGQYFDMALLAGKKAGE